MNISSVWYGNDRIEIVAKLQQGSSKMPVIDFTIIRNTPNTELEITSDSLCSPDISRSTTVGSRYIASSTLEFKQINLPIDSSFIPTDFEIRNKKLFITSNSNKATDPDLFVVDINNPENPILLGSVDTGPGLSSLTLLEKRIYAAAASKVSQLHIIRYDNLGNLLLENRYKVPLPFATATAPFATATFGKENTLFLGSEKWAGEELMVIDVSDPFNPSRISGYEISSKVNYIYARNNNAYVASSDFNELITLDITNLHNLILKSYFGPTGWQRQDGKSISVFEDRLLYGRTSGGFDLSTDHELFLWSSSSPHYLPFSINSRGGVYGIVDNRHKTYLVSNESNMEFKIFDSSDNNLELIQSSSSPLFMSPLTIKCDGKSIYVLARNNPILYEIKYK